VEPKAEVCQADLLGVLVESGPPVTRAVFESKVAIYRSVWCGSDAIFPEAIRCHDRGRHSYLQNGPRSQTNLRPDAGTQMGDRHGRLCLVRGHVPQLRRSSRNRSTYSGGRLRQRLSTPS
jgi:hypothetical protein